MNQSDALEAAKLAALVGSQLKTVDSYTSERTSNPANKINIQSFINQVKNPNNIHRAKYLSEPPAGFAAPPPEHIIQQQVPDISIGSKNIEKPELQQSILNTDLKSESTLPQIPVISNVSQPQPIHNDVMSKEMIDILKNIDKTLVDLLAYMKESISYEQ